MAGLLLPPYRGSNIQNNKQVHPALRTLGLYAEHSHLKRSSGTCTRAWLGSAGVCVCVGTGVWVHRGVVHRGVGVGVGVGWVCRGCGPPGDMQAVGSGWQLDTQRVGHALA